MAKHKHAAVIPWNNSFGVPINNSNSNIYYNNRVTDNDNSIIDNNPIVTTDADPNKWTVISDSESIIITLDTTKSTKKSKLPRRKPNDPTIRVNDWVRLRMPTLMEVSAFTRQVSSAKGWTSAHEKIVNRNQPVRVIEINSYNVLKLSYSYSCSIQFPLCCATRIINKSATNNNNDSVNVITDTDRIIKLD